MALFEVARSTDRTAVKSLVKKAKTKTQKQITSKGTSLFEKIKKVCDFTQNKLGKYENDFEVIITKERLKEYIDVAIYNGIISIDTETTGLNPITDQIVGACIYTPNEKAAYVPINHISYITLQRTLGQLTQEEASQQFQRLVENKTKILFFNAKFDIRVIRNQLGVYLEPYWDGIIAAKCLNEAEESHNLKYLWNLYCNEGKDEIFTFEDLFQGISFNMVPVSTAYLYAAKDALMTYDLYKYQEPFLNEQNEVCKKHDMTRLARLFKEIEMPIITTIADIEDTGVAIDIEYCQQLTNKYRQILSEKQNAFNKELENYKDIITSYLSTYSKTALQNPVNLASPTQLAELFYDILQVEPVSRKKPRGTGEDILLKMNHPLSKLILEWREPNKLLTTYIEKMPNILNPKTHRIHGSFNQYGADTGRFSSSDPNLQNIPSHNEDIRPMFIATRELRIPIKNNTLELILEDEVATTNGIKLSQDLIVGDILIDGKYQLQITEIQKEEEFFHVTIQETELKDFYVKRLHVFIGGDFSQQEPKITAHLSNDEKFIADCAAGKDAYATIASIVFNMPYEECLEFRPDGSTNKEGKERRSTAKWILLGICYGKSIQSLAADLNKSIDEAQKIYDGVLHRLPGLRMLIEQSQSMAKKLGYVETNWGRRRHIPDMQLEPYILTTTGTKNFDPFFDSEELGVKDETEKLKAKYLKQLQKAKDYFDKDRIKKKAQQDGFIVTDNTKRIEDATRLCVNSRVQGSAADQGKIAIRLIAQNEILKKYLYKPILLVHDEIIGECPTIFAKYCYETFRQCMLDSSKDLRTGAKVDAVLCFRWYGKQYKLEDLKDLQKLKQEWL